MLSRKPRAEAELASAVAQPTPVTDPALKDAYLSGWFQNDTGELLKGFPIVAEDIVLDVGCGNGGHIHFCARQGAEVIFVDIDAAKVIKVEKLLAGSGARSIRPIISDSNPLPLPDEVATKIVCMEILEHVDDPAQIMRELLRVGRPGAKYLLTVPDPVAEDLQKSIALPYYFEKPNHIRVFQREEFVRLVTNAGLVIEQQTSYGFYSSMWWTLFWACEQEPVPPWHPLLENWAKTWDILLALPQGPHIKQVLDEFMPKSQIIIARKPGAS